MDTSTTIQPGPNPLSPEKIGDRREVIYGLIPFVVLGSALVLLETAVPEDQIFTWHVLAGVLLLGGFILCLAGLLIGWLRGFPRWVIPYLAISLVYSFYLSNAATPGLQIFGVPLFGSSVWGWHAYIPLGVVALLALTFSRSGLHPWRRLANAIYQDWTLISFGFYTLVIFLGFAGLDEVESSYSFWATLVGEILVVAGAFCYLRAQAWLIRLSGLLICGALVAMVMVGTGNVYWQTHTVNFASGVRTTLEVAIDWGKMLRSSFSAAGMILLLMVLPMTAGILRWIGERLRKFSART